MIDLNAIFEKIYKYYPRGVRFDSECYKLSKEYLLRLSKMEEARNDLLFGAQLTSNLNAIFKGYAVMDWTALDMYNCYEYRILLHKNQPILDDDTELIRALNNERIDLLLFISVLEKYYFFQTICSKYIPEMNEWKFSILDTPPIGLRGNLNEMNEFFAKDHYESLDIDIAKVKITDVETELKSMGTASVFDCLFTDLISII